MSVTALDYCVIRWRHLSNDSEQVAINVEYLSGVFYFHFLFHKFFD